MHEVMPKLRMLREVVDRRHLELQIGIDGGVNLETAGVAHESGGDVLVVGSALYSTAGDLAPTVAALRDAAQAHAESETDPSAERT